MSTTIEPDIRDISGSESSQTALQTPSKRSSSQAHPMVYRAKLHRRIWRWHFYAGLLSAPVLLIAAITGSLYVFRVELESIFYSERLTVTPATTAVTYDQQLAARSDHCPPNQWNFNSLQFRRSSPHCAAMYPQPIFTRRHAALLSFGFVTRCPKNRKSYS